MLTTLLLVYKLEEAISYYKQCKVIFNDASMNMCKWVSNSNDVMKHIKQEDKSNEKSTKTLGMMWNIEMDELTLLKHTNLIVPDVITKRNILRIIASVYDPLGLLSPIMVKPKLLLHYGKER